MYVYCKIHHLSFYNSFLQIINWKIPGESRVNQSTLNLPRPKIGSCNFLFVWICHYINFQRIHHLKFTALYLANWTPFGGILSYGLPLLPKANVFLEIFQGRKRGCQLGTVKGLLENSKKSSVDNPIRAPWAKWPLNNA